MSTDDPFEHLRAQLRVAADRRERPARSARPWRASRPLLAVVIGLTVVGTATAAIVSSSDTSELSADATGDSQAAVDLAPRIASAKQLREVLRQVQAGTITKGDTHVLPDAGAAAGTKGTTVSRGPVRVKIAYAGDQVCTSVSDAPKDSGGTQCATRPFQRGQLPIETGQVDGQAWLVAIAPDGVSNVRATGNTGATTDAVIKSNVAIALVPDATSITSMSWTTADGSTITKSTENGARVRPLEIPDHDGR